MKIIEPGTTGGRVLALLTLCAAIAYFVFVTVLAGCFHEDPVAETGPSATTDTSSSTSTTTSSSTDVSTSATTAADVSTSSTDETTGDTSTQTGDPDSSGSSSTGHTVVDWALYFDGDASMTSTAAVDLALEGDFTAEAWIRFDSADSHGAIVSHRGVGTTGWALGIDNPATQIRFGFYDNNGAWHEVVGPDVADFGIGWHHVAGTKSGTSLFLHVDGDVVATGACALVLSAPVVPLLIGTDADEDTLTVAALDDIRVSAGARYQGAFDPDAELAADLAARVFVQIDEGAGMASFDTGSSALTFDLQGATWEPGNTEP